MKQEDFERLKAVCEKEGFELLKSLPDKDINFHILAVSKKDVWDGVEFAICQGVDSTIRKIIKTDDKYGGPTLHFSNGDDFIRSYCKPSTEQAYIEQLKKEAYEKLSGYTKTGLDITGINGGAISTREEFVYRKDTDTLYWFGCPVYQQGKWATRVKERVEVEMSECVANFGTYQPYTIEAKFTIKNVNDYDHSNLPSFLRSQLEKYLNREVE